MLGRRLDRYITSFFLWHFVLCLAAVVGLYVIVDTFAKLDDFVEHEGLLTQLRWIATYHLYQIPVLVSQFLPIVALLAGIISLARLAAHNELNAIKAAGVSIHRTLMPMLLAAVVIGALGAANQEFVVPNLQHDIRSVRAGALKDKRVYHDLFAYDEELANSVWVRQLLNTQDGYTLTRLHATPTPTPPTPDPAEAPPREPTIRSIRCATAIWADHWLFLFDGTTTTPEGQTIVFAHKTLRTLLSSDRFTRPTEPTTKLADGTPAYLAPATLDGHELRVAFAAYEPCPKALKLIRGGQIASVRGGERASAPIDVKAALWHNEQWLARGQTYIQQTAEKRELRLYDGDPLPLTITPPELIRSRTDPTLKSFAELRRLAERLPMLRQRILVDLHGRIAFPFASLVLLIVAVPFLFQQEGGKGTWLGVGLALFVSVCFYVVTYALQAVGRDPNGVFGGTPWVAAWLPVLLFAAAGTVLLYNMDS